HDAGLAKGQWMVKNNEALPVERIIDWETYDIKPLDIEWEITMDVLHFSVPIGLDMVNDVIIKPYAVETDLTLNVLPNNKQDAFLLLVDRYGKWRVNTAIRGFTNRLGGMASSYSTTGDFVFIGKSKHDILLAWKRLKELGGGIVVV